MRFVVPLALVVSSLAGCCFGVPVPSVDVQPSDPLATAPIPPAPPPALPPVVPPQAPVLPAAPVREPEGHLSAGAWASLGTGWVAQAPGATQLWDRATAHEGELERALLVCRARVRGAGWDDSFFAGGADVSLATRIGEGEIRRTPQTPARIYTLPVARLRGGDTFWVRVIDDDIFFDDTIAEGATSFARAPFTLTMGQADVECRAVPSAIVARESERQLAAMARAIDRLEVPEPDVTAYDLGYPRSRTQPVIEAAQRVSAWIDWSDPALVAQIDRARGFEDVWDERAERAIEQALVERPAPGTPVEIGRGRTATIDGMVCGRAAESLLGSIPRAGEPPLLHSGCVLRVTIATGSTRLRLSPIGPGSPAPLESWAIDAVGRSAAIGVLARRDESGWIADPAEVEVERGESVELVLSIPYGFTPVLLRMRDAPSRAVALRIE